MKQKQAVEFKRDNITLAGVLELPDHTPDQFCLFAHCFTCGKDVLAATRIAKELVLRGYGVLRFDFAGIGASGGDFADTNFSSNVEDLIAAADFLRQTHKAPCLLIGHSLGGAAVLKAAQQIPESVAIVTIGAPYEISHVTKQFQCHIDQINTQGEANVTLGTQERRITKQFLEDVEGQTLEDIDQLKKALLVMHSPLDQTVSIKEAESIYTQAKHPKSFISLDKADHLLTNKADAQYVAFCVSAWASKFIQSQD